MLMHSRWYSVTVVLLWLAAMTWLVVYKVLPPLLVGEQPSFSEVLDAQQREAPVAWRLSLNGRKLGWAISATSRLPDGSTQIRSRVHFDHLPVEQFMRGWLIRQVFRVVEPPAVEVEMDTRSILVFDADDRLSAFESSVWLGSTRNLIRVEGTVEGNYLTLSVSLRRTPGPAEAAAGADSAAEHGGRCPLAADANARAARGTKLDDPVVQPAAARQSLGSRGG